MKRKADDETIKEKRKLLNVSLVSLHILEEVWNLTCFSTLNFKLWHKHLLYNFLTIILSNPVIALLYIVQIEIYKCFVYHTHTYKKKQYLTISVRANSQPVNHIHIFSLNYFKVYWGETYKQFSQHKPEQWTYFYI